LPRPGRFGFAGGFAGGFWADFWADAGFVVAAATSMSARDGVDVRAATEAQRVAVGRSNGTQRRQALATRFQQ
jgi:hypothetical protein